MVLIWIALIVAAVALIISYIGPDVLDKPADKEHWSDVIAELAPDDPKIRELEQWWENRNSPPAFVPGGIITVGRDEYISAPRLAEFEKVFNESKNRPVIVLPKSAVITRTNGHEHWAMDQSSMWDWDANY